MWQEEIEYKVYWTANKSGLYLSVYLRQEGTQLFLNLWSIEPARAGSPVKKTEGEKKQKRKISKIWNVLQFVYLAM